MKGLDCQFAVVMSVWGVKTGKAQREHMFSAVHPTDGHCQDYFGMSVFADCRYRRDRASGQMRLSLPCVSGWR